ncbi:MAG TPA: hypothetical protein DCZ69_14750 [Syntrophobacteraceae bacterium]|nr:hypothetical protein [Syntrophobacteraceae bacterium]
MAGFFISDRSFVGRCHPAVRLIALLLACLPPLFIRQPTPALAIIALYVLVTVIVGAGKNLWRIKWLILMFLLVCMILWPVFQRLPGPPLFRLGPYAPTRESISFALAMGLRLIALLLAGIIFLSTTRVEDIAHGMQKLGMPYRAAFTFSLAFRLTPLFLDTATQIAAAQKARGLDLDNLGMIKRLKSYVSIVTPVLIAALRRAEGLALALESKGFGRSGERTSIAQYRVGLRDCLLIVCLTGLVGFTVSWRWDFWGCKTALEDLISMFTGTLLG